VVVPKSIDPETFVEVCTQLLELPRLQWHRYADGNDRAIGSVTHLSCGDNDGFNLIGMQPEHDVSKQCLHRHSD